MPKRRTGGRRIPGASLYLASSAVAFTPSALSGQVLWFAADTSTLWQDSARTTPATTDGTVVGAWDDLSGLNHHGLQAGATLRPLLKLALLNGLPMIRFDGVNDYLRASFTLIQPEHVFIVAQVLTRTGLAAICDGGGGAPDSMELRIDNTTPSLSDAYAGAFISTTLPNSLTTGVIYSLLYNGTPNSSAFANGTSYGTANSGATGGGGITLGAQATAARWCNVDIAEVIIYNRALNTPERRQVEAYLAAKYAITVV